MDDDKQNGGLVTRICAWLRSPFSPSMDAVHWFLFFGLVLVITFLWSRIMHYVHKGIEA